ncbi:MAG: vanadium-dependent haloperoxidase [Gemmatimonadaceae bacterium]|nr:vanadium-dependent haloperoxidase [Gemmatimonadaceae bacterium]NUO92907.1 vanadium-dependent haloperoxidase [Gemmatimonadaceae bacterium]
MMVGALVVTMAGCAIVTRDSHPAPPDAEALHAAVHQLSGVMVYDIFSPPQASRVYAYATVAAYEALRAGHPEYRSFAGQLNGLTAVPAPDPGTEYSLSLAGVHAFMTVGRQLTFSRARMDSLRSAMDERFRGTLSPAVYDRSVAYGDTVAKHVLAWASTDRFLQTRGYPKYTVSAAPGRWVPTPPAYMDAIEANWGVLRPFVMDSGSLFRPAAPPSFDTTKSSAYMRMVSEVLETSRHLTDEQRAIAAFWDCNPYVMHVQGHTMFATKKITPGGHWMGIVAIASRNADADIMRSSEAYARTALAMADAFIATWAEKYRSNVARPETMINAYLDERWEPVLQTPPFPEYPSGHSVVSTAAATALTQLYGDSVAFVDSSEVEFGLPARSFPSFEAAAAEAAISRLYAGIHYRPAIDEGARVGRQVGSLLVSRVATHDPRAKQVVAAAPVRAATAGER